MDMEIDVARIIGATFREVQSREYEGKPARVVIATRTYDTDPDDLWNALTSAERIPRWFLPITGKLQPGGRYQLEGNAGGTITRCDPPNTLAVTWEYGGDVSWVTVTLAADAAGGTKLQLEHVAHVAPEFWDQFGPGAVGVGWDMAMMGLGEHVAGKPPVDRAEAMAWTMTANGKDFIRLSSDDWRRASIGAGTPEKDATEAAERTRQFYTGEGAAATEG